MECSLRPIWLTVPQTLPTIIQFSSTASEWCSGDNLWDRKKEAVNASSWKQGSKTRVPDHLSVLTRRHMQPQVPCSGNFTLSEAEHSLPEAENMGNYS